MNTGHRVPRLLRTFILAVLVGSSGCQDSADGGRPSDGLIGNDLLQVVVDAGIARDADALRGYLDHSDPVVRARALFQLASMPGAVPKSELLTRLGDDDERVRADAAFALGHAGDTLGTTEMVRTLRDESDPRVRLRLIEALGNSGGRGAAALLLRTEFGPEEHAAFALALARLGHRGVNNAMAVERLLELMESEDEETRRNAAFYFGRSSSPAFWRPVTGRLRERLQALEPSDETAAWILLALALVGHRDDTDAIVSWLSEAADWRTRYIAAAALRPRGQVDGVPTALFAALGDESPHVRITAADALRRMPEWDDQQASFVRVWIDEHADDWRVGGLLLAGLAVRNADGIAEVRGWMERHAENDHAVASGLRALASVQSEDALTLLLDATSGEGATASAALETLAERWTAGVDDSAARYYAALSAAASTTDPMKVTLAAGMLADSAFARLGSRSILTSALETMDGIGAPGATAAVIAALGATGESAAEMPLRAMLDHPVRSIRAAAAGALTALTGEQVAPDPASDPVDRRVDWELLAEIGPNPTVVLETDVGEVVLQLDAEQAPLSVSSFVTLVREGAYDGVPFHRVVPFFLVQGGDIDRGDGHGSAGFSSRTEATRIPFRRGTLGMASAGPDTEGSQFVITHVLSPHLDGGYSAFGTVTSGQNVVDRLERWHTVRSARLDEGR